MIPDNLTELCAPRPITPGEFRFLSRIGRETGIDLSAYGLTDNLLVKPITPNPCGGITFNLNGEEYQYQRDYYILSEGRFFAQDGNPVEFVLCQDTRGNLYEMDVFIYSLIEPPDYPLDSEPIIIEYPHGEIEAAAVQSIPWQNPTCPPLTIEIRKIRPDEFDFLSRLAHESGVDLFSFGLSEELLVKPRLNRTYGDLAFMVDGQPFSGNSHRSVIAGTFRDSDEIPSRFTITIDEREKLELLMIHRADRRPLNRFPQASDYIEFYEPRPPGKLT